MKKGLIVNGHPYKLSFNYVLSEAYQLGLEATDNHTEILNIADIDFNLNLQSYYTKVIFWCHPYGIFTF